MERCIDKLRSSQPEMYDLIDKLDVLYHQDCNLSLTDIKQLIREQKIEKA
jgi:hypothetical protein